MNQIESRAIEYLVELSDSLSWNEIASLLQEIESNKYKLAKKYRISVHRVNSIEHLCTEQKKIPRCNVGNFVLSKLVFDQDRKTA